MNKPVHNLLYHITPMGNYRWNLEQIRKRLPLFNGKKIAFVTQGNKNLEDIEVVRKLLPGVELIAKPNDATIRETATFLELVGKVYSLEPNEITFYAHTKGVTRGGDSAVKMWTEALYKYNLDNIEEVHNRIFTWYPVVGVFKRYGTFGIFPPQSKWHYSGTFFWFRNSELFKRNWTTIVKTRYGTEAYLSLLFTSTEAGCIFGDNIGNLYDLKYIRKILTNKLPTHPLI